MKEKSTDDGFVSSEDNDKTPVIGQEDIPSSVGGDVGVADKNEMSNSDPEFVLLQVDGDTTTIDDVVKKLSGNTEENLEVPEDYIFPSFIVFMLYGPFVTPDQQLMLLLIDDSAVKKCDGTRKKEQK